MFTGIIETTGIVQSVEIQGLNHKFVIQSPISAELKVDQSLGHDGVCLTVESVMDGLHHVTAIAETLDKSNLQVWKKGRVLNLERCMQMNGRLDGHIVQGHVDTTAECIEMKDKNGSWEFTFQFDPAYTTWIIEKGSVTVNGISLTVFNVTEKTFTVAIIPYTFNHTNMQYLRTGDMVNIEFDVIGKYVNRILSFQNQMK